MLRSKLQTKGERIFNIVNIVFMVFILVIMIYPIINQIAVSFSSNTAVLSGHVSIWPKNFNLSAYQQIISDKNFARSFKNTVFYTIVCTIIQMVLTTIFAYPLSKKHLVGRQTIMTLLIFSMMFGTGGLIPNYILVKSLGMVNKYSALILPVAINIWNLIILKNFFSQIPDSLEEAAFVDGASVFTIFIKVVIPLSIPALAAITMFSAIAAWNTFFTAIIYITVPEKKLLQVYLNDILQANIVPESGPLSSTVITEVSVNPESLKAASLICTITPIIMVYPFIQKYFMSGLMVGSVKG